MDGVTDGQSRLTVNLNLLKHALIEKDNIIAFKIGDDVTITISLYKK